MIACFHALNRKVGCRALLPANAEITPKSGEEPKNAVTVAPFH